MRVFAAALVVVAVKPTGAVSPPPPNDNELGAFIVIADGWWRAEFGKGGGSGCGFLSSASAITGVPLFLIPPFAAACC